MHNFSRRVQSKKPSDFTNISKMKMGCLADGSDLGIHFQMRVKCNPKVFGSCGRMHSVVSNGKVSG